VTPKKDFTGRASFSVGADANLIMTTIEVLVK
jgi:hypothetical protein